MAGELSDLQGVALASRLIRLGEQIRKDVGRIYKEQGIDWEPKWSPVLLILIRKSPMGIQELADELGYTHPSVIALVKEMEDRKLIRSHIDKTDKRKRLLTLTPRALAYKNELQPVCDLMNEVVQEITNTQHNLLLALDETEQLLQSQNFYQRYGTKTDNNGGI
jgi:DNA-binding MarR family transcriptional regulator